MNERLTKYFSRLLSQEEKAELFNELDQEKNGKEKFAKERNLFSVIMMREREGDNFYAQRKFREFKQKKQGIIFRKFSLQFAKYAAIIVFTIALWTIYRNHIHPYSENLTYTAIEVPPGQRTHIFLPDGTSVWLNAETKLSYPTDFSVKNRVVHLYGEGYFDVTSDRKNPFVVHTSLMSVQVLGTKFNVKSYTDETSFVTLMEGEVEIAIDEKNNLILHPNEQVSISVEGDMTLSKIMDAEYANKWIAGEFNYLNNRLADIVKDLERRFGVTITIEDKNLANEIFTYRAEDNITIYQILNHLRATKELDYESEDKSIRIFKLE